jgi:hypothetical protein
VEELYLYNLHIMWLPRRYYCTHLFKPSGEGQPWLALRSPIRFRTNIVFL